MRIRHCDVCLGSDFEIFVESSRCGRKLMRCRDCGLVEAASPASPSEGIRLPRSRPGADAQRAGVVRQLVARGRVLQIGCDLDDFLGELDPDRYETMGSNSDLSSMHLDAEAFDLVVLFGALGRSASPRALLMEAVRLLHDGGHAIIEIPSLSSLTARLLRGYWAPFRDPTEDFFFTQPCLERLATTCGLLPARTQLRIPSGWPGPGNLLYVTRKTSETVKAHRIRVPGPRIRGARRVRPLGATR